MASHSYHNLYRDLMLVRRQEFLEVLSFRPSFSCSSEKGFMSTSDNGRTLSLTINKLNTNKKMRGNDVIDILTTEDMENTVLKSYSSRMNFTSTVVYFPLKHSRLYNKYSYLHTDTDMIR